MANLVVTHETSAVATSNIVHHWLKAGEDRFGFDEDTKVSVFLVNGTQIPRLEDAMIRAHIAFRDQVARKNPPGASDDAVLAVLDHEIDRMVAARRRSSQ